MSLFHPIHHTFAPLADRAQVWQAAGLLFTPWRWKKGPEQEQLKRAISKDFSADAFLFSSGREALFALLKAMNIGAGDEVIVQAYTCIVVPNAIHAAGATPVYVDIEKDTLNLDPEAVQKAITPKTKAVICQHTFGIPSPLSELREICDRKKISLIEDCAHLIPDAKGPVGVARTGEYAIFSFGRDKGVSGVSGGAVISHVKVTSDALREMETSAPSLSLIQIKRYLLYPLLYSKSKPFYGLGIGKASLALAAKLTLLPPIVTAEEKRGKQEPIVHMIPNACAAMALKQWQKRQQINDHRRAITSLYLRLARTHKWPVVAGACEGLPLQKFPLFLPNAEKLRQHLKTKNIHLYDGWTGCVVCPAGMSDDAAGYTEGSDPKAEEACKAILSLPTHPGTSVDDAKRLVRELQGARIQKPETSQVDRR